MMYSYGGFCGPITDHTLGFETAALAKDEATALLLERFPKPWASEPQSVHDELRDEGADRGAHPATDAILTAQV